MNAAAHPTAKPKSAVPEVKKKAPPERPVPPAPPAYLQAMLAAGPANDPLEAEAERVATQISGGGPPPAAPPAAPPPGGARGPQRVAASDASPTASPSPPRGGEPLPAALRAQWEPRFGADLSAVRVHTGAEAAQAARAQHALAFTQGPHITFAEGAYDPRSDAGRRLLAHELTHTVQQGAAPLTGAGAAAAVSTAGGERVQRWGLPSWDDITDAVSSAADTVVDTAAAGAAWVGEKVEQGLELAGEALAELGWSLVRQYAPALEPILKQGPFEWLKEKLGGVFDAVFSAISGVLPGPLLETLGNTFGPLLEKAGGILSALLSGDCKPLFTALGQIKAFVTQVAGEAWDGLKELFAPIGQFFSDLWNSVGAPAVDWLSQAAGGLWEELKQLGSDIWAWTQPIRDTAAAAWGWLKEQLFGADEGGGDSSGGIVNWIKGKAGEAWEWVKEQTKPVWEPVKSVAETVASFIPPPFIASLGEKMQQAGDGLNDTAAQIEGEGAVENRESLAEVLPSIDQVLTFARDALVGAGQWLLDTLGGFGERVDGFLKTLAATPLIGRLAPALEWLRGLATGLLTWHREKVATLLNAVVGAFDWLSENLLKPLLSTFKSVAEVLADLLQLPTLVLGWAWNLIPKCIRDPIRDFLINHIIAHIPLIGQFAQMGDIWGMIQETVIGFLKKVFKDGDLGGAVWFVLKTILKAVGVPVEWVLKVFGNVLSVIGDILLHPFTFIGNLIGAVVDGAKQFGAHILDHLGSGLLTWLFGSFGDRITLPADFSLSAILGLVLQILGITPEKIEEKARKLFGDQAVDLFLTAMDWINTLIRDGIGGIWEEIKSQLSDLWGSVIGGITEWVTTKLVVAGTIFLANLATGYGAIVEAILGIYNTFMAVVERFKEILGFIESVTDSIQKIAKGETQEAADGVERSFGTAVPVVLTVLARLAKLGNPASAVQNVIEGIRNSVDKALDWLVEKARGIAERLLGKKKGDKGKGKQESDIGEPLSVETPQEKHTLFVEVKGDDAEVMMASRKDTLANHLEQYKSLATKIPERGAKKQAEKLIKSLKGTNDLANKIVKKMARLAMGRKKDTAEYEKLAADLAFKEKKLDANLEKLIPLLHQGAEALLKKYETEQPLKSFEDDVAAGLGQFYDYTQDTKNIRRKEGVTDRFPLLRHKDGKVGVDTGDEVKHWKEGALSYDSRTSGAFKAAIKASGYLGAYTGKEHRASSVAYGFDANGHLIGNQFGGSGGKENMSPMQRKVNSPVFSIFENALKDAMVEAGVRVHMTVEGEDNSLEYKERIVGGEKEKITGGKPEWQALVAAKGTEIAEYRTTKKDREAGILNTERVTPEDNGDLDDYLKVRPMQYRITVGPYEKVETPDKTTPLSDSKRFVQVMYNPIDDSTAQQGAMKSYAGEIEEKLKQLGGGTAG